MHLRAAQIAAGEIAIDEFLAAHDRALALGAAGGADGAVVARGAVGPDDDLAGVDVTCRPSAGACDLAETCTGDDVDCPADALVEAGIVCRESSSECDAAEHCSGEDDDCPLDELMPPR